MDKRRRVRGRTFPIVDAGHVRHVRVIGLVEINAVPAGLELDLRAQAIDALRAAHGRRFRHGGGVQARETHAVGHGAGVEVGFGGRGVGAQGAVVGNHAEAGREGDDASAVVAAAEVVDCHAAVGHFLEGAVGVLVVEQGGPVGGFVGLDLA